MEITVTLDQDTSEKVLAILDNDDLEYTPDNIIDIIEKCIQDTLDNL